MKRLFANLLVCLFTWSIYCLEHDPHNYQPACTDRLGGKISYQFTLHRISSDRHGITASYSDFYPDNPLFFKTLHQRAENIYSNKIHKSRLIIAVRALNDDKTNPIIPEEYKAIIHKISSALKKEPCIIAYPHSCAVSLIKTFHKRIQGEVDYSQLLIQIDKDIWEIPDELS